MAPPVPLLALRLEALSYDIDRLDLRSPPVDGTGKRKVDGELAATRLGSTATDARGD